MHPFMETSSRLHKSNEQDLESWDHSWQMNPWILDTDWFRGNQNIPCFMLRIPTATGGHPLIAVVPRSLHPETDAVATSIFWLTFGKINGCTGWNILCVLGVPHSHWLPSGNQTWQWKIPHELQMILPCKCPFLWDIWDIQIALGSTTLFHSAPRRFVKGTERARLRMALV